jgi:predicted ester cyclase
VEQARYTGTHTGTWRNPDGAEIPATGKKLDFSFVGVFRVERSKISSIRLYYDQVEVFTQLGLMPGATST